MRTEPAIPDASLAAIRAPFEAQAATRAEPPIVQPLNLFLDLAGEAMRARLFVVQADGREEACLRPELTIPVARMHVESGAAAGRYAYEGKAFRAMPRGGDTAHSEEFLQIGLEAYGDIEVEVEAQIVTLAWRSASAGGRSDLTLRLGDAALFSAFLDGIGVSSAASGRLRRAFGRPALTETLLGRVEAAPAREGAGRLAEVLAGLSEDDAAGLLEELWSLADIRPVGGRPAGEIVGRLIRRGAEGASSLSEDQAEQVRRYLAIDGEPAAALDAIGRLAAASGADLSAHLDGWSSRLGAIAAAGAPLDRARFCAGFGRGFGYYDGFLFDVVSQALGEDRAVAGGGRYDSLLVRLGSAHPSGAVGCMVRPGRACTEAAE
jgi:ATP phosphoribosyltransferase regulatory subunit